MSELHLKCASITKRLPWLCLQVIGPSILQLQYTTTLRACNPDGQQLQEGRAVQERGASASQMAQRREAESEGQQHCIRH